MKNKPYLILVGRDTFVSENINVPVTDTTILSHEINNVWYHVPVTVLYPLDRRTKKFKSVAKRNSFFSLEYIPEIQRRYKSAEILLAHGSWVNNPVII